MPASVAVSMRLVLADLLVVRRLLRDVLLPAILEHLALLLRVLLESLALGVVPIPDQIPDVGSRLTLFPGVVALETRLLGRQRRFEPLAVLVVPALLHVRARRRFDPLRLLGTRRVRRVVTEARTEHAETISVHRTITTRGDAHVHDRRAPHRTSGPALDHGRV